MTFVIWLSGETGWPVYYCVRVFGALAFFVGLILGTWSMFYSTIRWLGRVRVWRERKREEEC